MNKNRFFAFIWIFFLFLMQNAFAYMFAGKTPPLLLIGVIFYSLLEGPFFGMALGLYAGMYLEIFTAGPLGCQMAILALCGGLSGFIASKIFQENVLIQVLLPSLMFYFGTLLNLLILNIQLNGSMGIAVLFRSFLPLEILVTALVSPLVFSFLEKVTTRSFSRSSSWR